MVKAIFTYTIIIVGIMVLLYAAGINTSMGTVLGQFGIKKPSDVSNFESISFSEFIKDHMIELAAGSGALIIGTLVSGAFVIGVSAAIATTIFGFFIGDMITIVNLANEGGGYLGYIIFLIMLPLMYGYIVALIEWIMNKSG